MSLRNMATKLALAFAVTKGVQAVQKRGGIGQVMKDLQSGDISQAGSMSGMGGIIDQVIGKSSGSGGGLGGLLGQLAGGGGAATAGGLGGLSGLLGGLAGAQGHEPQTLESVLNQNNPADEPDEQKVDEVVIRAMLYAARADGEIDAQEQAKLLEAVREGDPEDLKLVQSIMREPVDATNVAQQTPRGAETQVYAMSVNAINTDNQKEARYLGELAQALGLGASTVNEIHDGLGAPRIHS